MVEGTPEPQEYTVTPAYPLFCLPEHLLTCSQSWVENISTRPGPLEKETEFMYSDYNVLV